MSPRSFQVRWKVTSSFSGIPFNRDQLERWKHHRCVQADDTDRYVCNMTFSDQVITLTWGQIFNMTFQGQIIYLSTRLDKRNTMLAKEMSWLYWVKSYYRKTIFAKKRLFLEFLLSGGQTVYLRWILKICLRKNVKRAIECAFPRSCSSSGSRVMCRFVEEC